jgi:hypothetical protein
MDLAQVGRWAMGERCHMNRCERLLLHLLAQEALCLLQWSGLVAEGALREPCHAQLVIGEADPRISGFDDP